MAEDSDLEKTEAASPKRVEDARKEGNVPQSRELQTFFVLMGGVAGLWMSGRWLTDHLLENLRQGLTLERSVVFDPQMMIKLIFPQILAGALSMLPLVVILLIAAVAAPMMMGGMNFSVEALGFKFSRMNPLQGIKRFVSVNGLIELIKSLIKSVMIAGVGIKVMWAYREDLLNLMRQPLHQAIADFGHLLLMASLLIVCSVAVLALIDVPYQIWHYFDEMKMSKQELKDEGKQSEGDPLVKSQIRARQREMARRRMMESVPKADVVVTNPTHFAVALKYEAGKMAAPTIVAKGSDLVAANIRKIASENGVPLLEAPPLARALFRHAEIGEQVPAALYTAVAEVMAYVYQLNHFLAQGGTPPQAPDSLPVPAAMDPLAASPVEAE